MKKLKKLIAGVLAIISATYMLPFICSASGPKTFDFCKDPNNDGVLNMADVATIIQCLSGYYFPPDYKKLDMDNNGLVTQVDALLIQCYLSGAIKKEVIENEK